jgi:hypothetical protein
MRVHDQLAVDDPETCRLQQSGQAASVEEVDMSDRFVPRWKTAEHFKRHLNVHDAIRRQ